MNVIPTLDRLAKSVAMLPGIGEKSALRMAMFLFNSDPSYLNELSIAIKEVHKDTRFCSVCHTITNAEKCAVCESDKRERTLICVVEDYMDMLAIERTEEYNGVFHVLHGLIAPLRGIGANDIKIKELIERTKKDCPREIIFALSHSLEADTTCSYIKRMLTDINYEGKLSRIAYGISLGSDIEYADSKSLARSISDRTNFE